MFNVFNVGEVLIDEIAELFLAFWRKQGTSRGLVLFIKTIDEVDLQFDNQIEDFEEGAERDASLAVLLEVDRSKRHNSVLNQLSLFSCHLHLLLLALHLILDILFMLGCSVGHGLLDFSIVFEVVLLD